MKTRMVQFGECAQIINGFAFKSDLFTTEPTGLPIARIRDVIRGRSETYYSGEYPQPALINNGDLLVGMDGELNLGEWQGGTALLNQRVCKIAAMDGLADTGYLKYAARIVLKRIEDRTLYVTVKHLSSEDLKEELFPLPSLPEQRRIAGMLEQADRLRRTRRYALELSDTFLPAAFLEMFGDPVRNPKGWPEAALADLVRKHDKINYGVVQPGLDLSHGVPIVRVGDLDDLPASRAGLKLIAPEIDERHAASRLVGDEVLVACVGSIGKMAKADANLRGCNIARAVARIPGEWDRVSRDFLAQYLATTRVQQYWTDETRTVSQPTLNILQIEETPVAIPPLPLQHRFAELVRGHERLRAAQRESLRQAEHLFQSLLHRAFAEAA